MKHTITIDIDIDVVDIPTMQAMSAAEYSSYIENSLLRVDHHDVLRAIHGDYPIATSSDRWKYWSIISRLWLTRCAELGVRDGCRAHRRHID